MSPPTAAYRVFNCGRNGYEAAASQTAARAADSGGFHSSRIGPEKCEAVFGPMRREKEY
jgi:hypothetical protein